MDDMGTLIARLGRFVDAMGAIIEELQLPKSCEFGAKVNDFNIFNVPDDLVAQSYNFWLDYNKPFLDQAVAGEDEIIMATKHVTVIKLNLLGNLTKETKGGAMIGSM